MSGDYHSWTHRAQELREDVDFRRLKRETPRAATPDGEPIGYARSSVDSLLGGGTLETMWSFARLQHVLLRRDGEFSKPTLRQSGRGGYKKQVAVLIGQLMWERTGRGAAADEHYRICLDAAADIFAQTGEVVDPHAEELQVYNLALERSQSMEGAGASPLPSREGKYRALIPELYVALCTSCVQRFEAPSPGGNTLLASRRARSESLLASEAVVTRSPVRPQQLWRYR